MGDQFQKSTSWAVVVGLIMMMLILMGITTGWLIHSHWATSTTAAVVGPPEIKLEQLRDLATLRVLIGDIIVAKNDRFEGALLIKGDALLAVALDKIQKTNEDLENRTLTVTLPPPHVLQSRVDHAQSRKWDIKNLSWIPWFGDQNKRDEMYEEAMVAAQNRIAQLGGSEEYLCRAQNLTEQAIINLYKLAGWNAQVVWK